MQGEFWILTSEEAKANAVAAIASCDINPKKPYYVQFRPYDFKRSDAQNRLSHKWYLDISEQGKEYTPFQIKCRCKQRYGLPIMLEDESFSAFWKLATVSRPSYETIVDKIMPIVPVTSLMGTKQMALYLSALSMEMGTKYNLTSPEQYGLKDGY